MAPTGTDGTYSVRTDINVAAIAEVLLRSAARTSGDQPFAEFDSVTEPGMHLVDYSKRLFKYFQNSHESSILGLVYINRFLVENRDFTLSVLNVHRMLLSSMVVAAKFFDDSYLYNSFYAQVGGVSVQELNTLEMKFLEVIRWKLHVEREEYEHFNTAISEQACSKNDIHPMGLSFAKFSSECRGQKGLALDCKRAPLILPWEIPLRPVCSNVSDDVTAVPKSKDVLLQEATHSTAAPIIGAPKSKDASLQEVSELSRATSPPPIRSTRLLRQCGSCRQSLSPAGRRRRLRPVMSAA